MIEDHWSRRAVLYEMNVRQLTPEGTLRAAAARLEFLRDMGIDAVWLMPVYPIGQAGRKGSLGSYYSIRDYCAVNPELGTLGDFDAFVAEARRLGIKTLLDWVTNHTSRDARWLIEKHSDWYERDDRGEPLVPFDWSDTAKLNYANGDVWRAQAESMEFWLVRGVDGFRCDMAMLVPIEFWHETIARLRAVKPDLFMLAEAEGEEFHAAGFDATYAWKMHHLMVDVAQRCVRLPALRERIHADCASYPRTAMRLAFTSNHDENSWGGADSQRLGDAREAMTALTFVVPRGLPLVYTGQEVGYDHSFAFFDRDPIPAAAYRANGHTDLYRRLAALRHDNAALASGGADNIGDSDNADCSMVELRNNAEDCLLTMVRQTPACPAPADVTSAAPAPTGAAPANCVVAVMNLSPYAIHADYHTGIYAGTYTDAMTGSACELPAHVEEDMAPWSYRILTR